MLLPEGAGERVPPKQVLIEYNGMWQMERLYREVLPANWVLYQIMTSFTPHL